MVGATTEKEFLNTCRRIRRRDLRSKSRSRAHTGSRKE
jgi:hypothetical protein